MFLATLPAKLQAVHAKRAWLSRDCGSPVGRVYYSFSTFLCVPNALSQEGAAGQKMPNRMMLIRPAAMQ